jgi:pimeloyl-ACP methyl ester carboxylesterase
LKNQGSFLSSPFTEATEAISVGKNAGSRAKVVRWQTLKAGASVISELADQAQGMAMSGYSLQDHWITLEGARMRYLRAGSGPPLILLHGLLGYSFSWRYAIPALAERSTVYAVDMLGVGFSDRPSGLDCCLHSSAKRLLGFMDAAGLPSCNLLGTSHGGAVAMMAAGLAPERIDKLILVAPVNPWSLRGSQMAAFLSHSTVAPIFLQLAPLMGFFHGPLLRRLFGDPKRIRPGTLEGYSAPFRLPGTFRYGVSVLRSWTRDLSQLEEALPRIRHIPALLIWGSEDRAVDPRSGDQLLKALDRARLVTFEGVGHLPYEEEPERFNQMVLDYLSCESQ